MSCLNSFYLNVWIIVCLNCVVISCNKPCVTLSDDEIERSAWIDEKGLLKYYNELDEYQHHCESCAENEKQTEAREVCYTTDYMERIEDTNICKWTENVTENVTLAKLSIRKFPNITGLKLLSVTKYKIENWLNIDESFSDLIDLEHLYLESNHITGWSTSESQEPLTKLRVLSLANNPIANLSENSFSWLKGSQLEFLNMRGCSPMKILDHAVFNPLANTNNLWLDLSYTIIEYEQLSNLTAGFQTQTKGLNGGLTVLSLAHTGLYRIPTEALKNVAHSLEKLSLQGNYFSTCWSASTNDDGNDCLLPTMSNLKEINLKDSEITDFPLQNVLNAVENLERLYLDDNPLVEMSCNQSSKISYISLKNIRRDRGFVFCANDCMGSFPALKSLDLSNTWVNISLSNFSSLSSLRNLSLCNSVTEKLNGLLASLSNLRILDLSNNNLRRYLDSESFKGLSNLEELRLQSCFLQEISSSLFTHLTNLKVLDMRHNFVRTLENSTFDGLQKLKSLILHENRIGSWNMPIFRKGPHLQILDLRGNWLSDITSDMELDFQSIEKIDISYNPFSCCNVVQFFDTCINNQSDFTGTCENQNFNFTLLNWGDLTAYACRTEDNVERDLQDLIDTDECTEIIPTTENNTAVATAFPSEAKNITYVYIIIGVIPIGGVICYWKRWHIAVFMRGFRRNLVLSMLKDNNTKGDRKESCQYDVFLSYSDRDREWILQQLIPNIEQRGHIKVCLHERDFQAGLPVLENIIACMDHSRCVLLVLSEAFLCSHWCQFELNLAQHRLLEMQHDRLILVLLENIPRDKCSKMLRYLMLTKTYLLWPDKDDDEEKLLFWRKLKKAIGPVQDTVNVSFV